MTRELTKTQSQKGFVSANGRDIRPSCDSSRIDAEIIVVSERFALKIRLTLFNSVIQNAPVERAAVPAIAFHPFQITQSARSFFASPHEGRGRRSSSSVG